MFGSKCKMESVQQNGFMLMMLPWRDISVFLSGSLATAAGVGRPCSLYFTVISVSLPVHSRLAVLTSSSTASPLKRDVKQTPIEQWQPPLSFHLPIHPVIICWATTLFSPPTSNSTVMVKCVSVEQYPPSHYPVATLHCLLQPSSATKSVCLSQTVFLSSNCSTHSYKSPYCSIHIGPA